MYSKQTYELAKIYATDRNLFNKMKSEGKVTSIESDLMSGNFTDYNFSALAEELPVFMMGYTPYEPKHGYDGYNGKHYDSSDKYLEVKPQKSYFHYDNNKVMNKLNGGGAFADYTLERFKKDKDMGDNLRMVIPGYVEGELAYIVSFPFNHPKFMNAIEEKTKDAIQKNKPRNLPGFSHTLYSDCEDLKIEYLAPEGRLNYMSKFISGPWLKKLRKINNEQDN